MTVKYYKIPVVHSDGRENFVICGVFTGDRPDFTADGYSDPVWTIPDLAAYLQEKTGVKMTALTPIVGNVVYNGVKNFYKNIIANSDTYNDTTHKMNIDNPYGLNEKDGYLYAKDGGQDNTQFNAQTNPGVKLSLSHQEGSIWFVNSSAVTRGGSSIGNICSGGRVSGFPELGCGGIFGLVWTSDLSFAEGTQIREYTFLGTGDDTERIGINSTSTFFAHMLFLIAQKGLLEEYESDTPPTTDDPNEPGGTSTPGGGQLGTFDDQSDPINVPGLPSLSAVDTGFVTIYNPALSEIKALSSYMWNANPTTIEFWKKLVADPMDLIIGLNIVPCAVQDGGRQNVKVGFIDTGVTMTKAASQYQELNCGSLTVEPFWDNVMDFSPFTKCKIYLPYIGVQDLNIDEIMGKTIQVVYHIDILSCACTCMIKCGNSVLYTFQGQCGQNIPVSSANYATMISGILQIAGAAAAIGVTGGAAAPAAAAGISSGAGTLLNGVPTEMTDPMQTGIPAGAPGGGMPAKSNGGGNAVHGTMQTVGNVMALKPSFAHSGSLSGTGGQLGVQTPYLIFERPRQSLPQGYKSFRGYPSNITATLGSLSGYTEVDSIHLDGIPALAPEIQELEKLLKSGVIL